jgi:hypothetical protein
MKMKSFKMALLGTIVLMSCSSNQSAPTTSTPTTTTPTPPTTVVPIDYGGDCTEENRTDYVILVAQTANARDNLDDNSNKSLSEVLESYNAYMESYRNLRSFIRNLDIPFADAERKIYVDIIQDYVDALNQFLESDFNNLSFNDVLIPLSDAQADFYTLFRKCFR